MCVSCVCVCCLLSGVSPSGPVWRAEGCAHYLWKLHIQRDQSCERCPELGGTLHIPLLACGTVTSQGSLGRREQMDRQGLEAIRTHRSAQQACWNCRPEHWGHQLWGQPHLPDLPRLFSLQSEWPFHSTSLASSASVCLPFLTFTLAYIYFQWSTTALKIKVPNMALNTHPVSPLVLSSLNPFYTLLQTHWTCYQSHQPTLLPLATVPLNCHSLSIKNSIPWYLFVFPQPEHLASSLDQVSLNSCHTLYFSFEELLTIVTLHLLVQFD